MVSPATHHVMQANRSEDTKPELVLRRALRERGLPGYRLHWRKASGRPDVCYPGRKVAIFVNGCFWHRCPHCDLPLPKTNTPFWTAKFERNRARDDRNHLELVEEGWSVVVVWECHLKGERLERTVADVERAVRRAGAEGPGHAGSLVEAGVTPPWRLARSRKRLAARR